MLDMISSSSRVVNALDRALLAESALANDPR